MSSVMSMPPHNLLLMYRFAVGTEGRTILIGCRSADSASAL